MKVKKIKKTEQRGTSNFFNFVVLYEGKELSFEKFKRFGINLNEKQMKCLLEDCKSPKDIFYLDDSKYDSFEIFQNYKKRFPEIVF